MVDLRLIVYVSETAKLADKKVFERIVSIPDSIDIPYQKLTDSMKFLFGRGSIVVFEIL